MSNLRKTTTESTRKKSKEKVQTDDNSSFKEKQKASSIATPQNYLTPKASASDIYSQTKKLRDKIGPTCVTDKNAPKITSRDISRSSPKDKNVTSKTKVLLKETLVSSKSVNTKSTSKTKILKSTKSTEDSKAKEKVKDNKNLQRGSSSSEITSKSSKRSTDVTQKTSQAKDISITKSETNTRKTGTPRLAKDLPFVGLLVHSPPLQRKIIKDSATVSMKEKSSNERSEKQPEKDDRQRSKTRTLNDNEIKVLIQEVDNNVEMKNLTEKLTAKPKAFFVDLDDKPKTKDLSDGDYSYEDDFESYESDFESYQSENTNAPECLSQSDIASDRESTDQNDADEAMPKIQNNLDDDKHSRGLPQKNMQSSSQNGSYGEPPVESYSHKSQEPQPSNSQNINMIQEYFSQKGRMQSDEEKMLDSGSFDLRDAQKSANKVKLVMDDIQEAAESSLAEDSKKQSSLTDEGFLEMSSSSAISSRRTLDKSDSLDRPTFIDFSRSKENKKRRLIRERQKQRAQDLLSMITLHQVSYILFDMKPIPYDNFMAIYGNDNANQVACQTFDDGVNEEIQTEEIYTENKWTQHPIDFSINEIHTKEKDLRKDDFLNKFKFLYSSDTQKREISDDYRENPLRIYLEQKNGVGFDTIMPYESYEEMTTKTRFNTDKLGRFLAKTEKKITRILCKSNPEDQPAKKSKWPFSKGYITLFENNDSDPKLFCLHGKTVSHVVFSETSPNLILTVHQKIELPSDELEKCSYDEALLKKCLICLWDLSIASNKTYRPIKVLAAVENVAVCRYRGDTDGVVAAALYDGSIQVWDLSEAASWHSELSTPTREGEQSKGHDKDDRITIRSCAYTSSALALLDEDDTALREAGGGGGGGGRVTALQFTHRAGDHVYREVKHLGQLCSLHQHGLLSFWTIVQEKRKHESAATDVGKAYWSKIRLKKSRVVNLADRIDMPVPEMSEKSVNFNLAAAKRRISAKRQEKYAIDNVVNKPHSTKSIDFDEFDEWNSVASDKNDKTASVLPVTHNDSWEGGVVCTDLKIVPQERDERLLIARNRGEVICCDIINGNVKVKRFKIACEATTITCVEVSRALPLLLAGSSAGRVYMFSLTESRTLLTMDCGTRRQPTGGVVESAANESFLEAAVQHMHWLSREPCAVLVLSRGGRLCAWELTRGDVAPAWSAPAAARAADAASATTGAAGGKDRAAVITWGGAVEVHEVGWGSSGADQERLFASYVALL